LFGDEDKTDLLRLPLMAAMTHCGSCDHRVNLTLQHLCRCLWLIVFCQTAHGVLDPLCNDGELRCDQRDFATRSLFCHSLAVSSGPLNVVQATGAASERCSKDHFLGYVGGWASGVAIDRDGASGWIAAIVVMAAGGCLGRLRSGGQSDQNSGGKLIRGIQSGPSFRWIAKPPCDIVGTLLTDLRSEV
jgi:hypothetical protein